LGYARVSTTEQHADLQRDALTRGGCWKVFTDHVTGTREPRPELDRLLEQVRPGDTLVVWRLDRLGRSLRHLIDVATDLGERGVGFRSLTENIDTVRTRAHPGAVEGGDGGGAGARADGRAADGDDPGQGHRGAADV
jgi:DNA invertase Pin-like site-specific DNA recombinase